MTTQDKNRQQDPGDPLSQQIANTLDQSLYNLDEKTLADLTNARQHALEYHSRKRQWMGGLAIAASVAALVVVPMMNNSTQVISSHPDIVELDSFESDMRYLTEDPEMLFDMDMLLAIGESQLES